MKQQAPLSIELTEYDSFYKLKSQYWIDFIPIDVVECPALSSLQKFLSNRKEKEFNKFWWLNNFSQWK